MAGGEGAATEAQEACGRCDGALSWVDEAWACSSGCTYCPDCKDELGGACANCSEMLHRIQRTRRIERTHRGRTGPSFGSRGFAESGSSEGLK